MEYDFLNKVLSAVRARIRRDSTAEPISALKSRISQIPLPIDFYRALKDESVPIKIIAEFKRSSPSKGNIRQDAEVEHFVRLYERAGAIAVSVLTEEEYFRGSMNDLSRASHCTKLPVLCKDFIIEAYQIFQARAAGASSVLLIARIIPSDEELRYLLQVSRALGMEPLVEIHDEEDLERALRAEARIIGVNSRNLGTLKVEPEKVLPLFSHIPPHCVAVAESGINGPEDLEQYFQLGVRCFLVGTYLMKSPDPEKALLSLVNSEP